MSEAPSRPDHRRAAVQRPGVLSMLPTTPRPADVQHVMVVAASRRSARHGGRGQPTFTTSWWSRPRSPPHGGRGQPTFSTSWWSRPADVQHVMVVAASRRSARHGGRGQPTFTTSWWSRPRSPPHGGRGQPTLTTSWWSRPRSPPHGGRGHVHHLMVVAATFTTSWWSRPRSPRHLVVEARDVSRRGLQVDACGRNR